MIIPARFKTLAATSAAAIILVPLAFAPAANAQSSGNEVTYRELLDAIAATKVSLAQQELFVAQQKEKIKSLENQLNGLDEWKASIEPMLGKMTTSIANQVKSDYPFEMDRRGPRIAALQNTIADSATSVGDKYRKALNVYKLEVNYGQSMEAKKGNHPINPTIRVGDEKWEKEDNGKIKLDKNGNKIEIFDGSYLRYGRLAYVYLQADSSEALRYDLQKKEWVKIPKSKIADIRRAVKMASGEAAPNVVKVPFYKDPQG